MSLLPLSLLAIATALLLLTPSLATLTLGLDPLPVPSSHDYAILDVVLSPKQDYTVASGGISFEFEIILNRTAIALGIGEGSSPLVDWTTVFPTTTTTTATSESDESVAARSTRSDAEGSESSSTGGGGGSGLQNRRWLLQQGRRRKDESSSSTASTDTTSSSSSSSAYYASAVSNYDAYIADFKVAVYSILARDRLAVVASTMDCPPPSSTTTNNNSSSNSSAPSAMLWLAPTVSSSYSFNLENSEYLNSPPTVSGTLTLQVPPPLIDQATASTDDDSSSSSSSLASGLPITLSIIYMQRIDDLSDSVGPDDPVGESLLPSRGSGVIRPRLAQNITCDNRQFKYRAAVPFTVIADQTPIAGGAGGALRLDTRPIYKDELSNRIRLQKSSTLVNSFTPVVVYDFGTCTGANLPLLHLKEFTLETWFRAVPREMQGEQDKSCCWPLVATSGDSGVSMGLVDGGIPQFMTTFAVGDCAVVSNSRVMGTSYLDNKWHHMAVTYTSNNTKQMYMDGVKILDLFCGADQSARITSSSFALGRSFAGTRLDGSFDGWLDETRFWSVARSQSEVRDTMFRTLRPDEAEALVFYYSFDDLYSSSSSSSSTADAGPSTPPPNYSAAASAILGAVDPKHILVDKGPEKLDIVMGVESLASAMDLRRVGRIVHSSAPIFGGPRMVRLKSPATSLPPPPPPPSPLPSRPSPRLTVLYTSPPFAFDALIAGRSPVNPFPENSPHQVTVYETLDTAETFLQLVFANLTAVPEAPFTFPISERFAVQLLNGSAAYSEQRIAIPYVVYDPDRDIESPTAELLVDVMLNRQPTAGNAGGMLYCDGSSFGYAKDFVLPASWQSGFSGTLPYTVEWWGYFFSQENEGTVYSFPTEVNKEWCGSPSQGQPFCTGRVLTHLPAKSDGAEIYDGWKVQNSTGVLFTPSVQPYFGTWNHFAVASDGAKRNGTVKFYINGRLVSSGVSNGALTNLLGLYVCHWPFWGDYHYYHGYIDNLRFWNVAKSQPEVRSLMYSTQNVLDTSLIGFWGFDVSYRIQPTLLLNETQSLSDALTTATVAQDVSVKRNDLIFGGCTPNTLSYCPRGSGRCAYDTPKEQRPCYIGDERDLEDGYADGVRRSARPSQLLSNSPIGGFSDPVIMLQNTTANVTLEGRDLDSDDVLHFRIVAVPSRGILRTLDGITLTASNVDLPPNQTHILYIPLPDTGGINVDSFAYRVLDGLSASPEVVVVSINIACNAGFFADETIQRCVPCRPGRYQPAASFKTSCTAVPPGGYYQPEAGARGFLACPPGQFQDEAGASYCKSCSLYDYPQPCVNSNDLSWGQSTSLAVLASLLLLCCLVFLVGIAAFRKTKVIHSSSPVFLATTQVGAIMLAVAILLCSFVQTDALCNARVWLVNVGFMTVFGSLYTKTWRLHKIFNAKSLQSMKVTDAELMKRLALFVLIDVAILTVWMIVAPFRVRSVWDHECVTDQYAPFVGLLLSIKGCLVVFGSYLSFKTRKILSAYNESKFIALGIYNVFLIAVLVYAIQFSLSSSLPARSILLLQAFGLLYGTFCVVLLIMAPKCVRLLKVYRQTSSVSALFATMTRYASKKADESDEEEKTDVTEDEHEKGSSETHKHQAHHGSSGSGTDSIAREGAGTDAESHRQASKHETLDHGAVLAKLHKKLEQKLTEQSRQTEILALAKKHLNLAQAALKLVDLEVHELQMEIDWRTNVGTAASITSPKSHQRHRHFGGGGGKSNNKHVKSPSTLSDTRAATPSQQQPNHAALLVSPSYNAPPQHTRQLSLENTQEMLQNGLHAQHPEQASSLHPPQQSMTQVRHSTGSYDGYSVDTQSRLLGHHHKEAASALSSGSIYSSASGGLASSQSSQTNYDLPRSRSPSGSDGSESDALSSRPRPTGFVELSELWPPSSEV